MSVLRCVDTLPILIVIFIVSCVVRPMVMLLSLGEEVVAYLRSTDTGILTLTFASLIADLKWDLVEVSTAARLLQVQGNILLLLCVLMLVLR